MGNRTAKFISTLFASIIAGAPLAAVSQTAPSAQPATTSTANAASDCLASPKGEFFDYVVGLYYYYSRAQGTIGQIGYFNNPTIDTSTIPANLQILASDAQRGLYGDFLPYGVLCQVRCANWKRPAVPELGFVTL